MLGVHREEKPPRLPRSRANRAEVHTYLRLLPELRSRLDGPKTGNEPRVDVALARHAVLKAFDETDLIPFGGTLEELRVESGTQVPLTYVPPFPTYPPGTAWMREPVTQIPGLVLRERGKSRIAYMPADLDRRYALQHLPDHANVLANIVRWALWDGLTVSVEGPGLIDCHVYRKDGRLLVHLVNLTNSATWRAPMDEVIPVAPVRLTVRRLAGMRYGREVQLRVSGSRRDVRMTNGVAAIEIGSIAEHELVVF